MRNNIPVDPTLNELPSHFADRLGLFYANSVNQAHKKENGQFFTPIEIAALMGSLSNILDSKLRVLDPGCGTAVLTCALIEYLINNRFVKSIEVVVYETDDDIIQFTQKSLNYLNEWLKSKEIEFNFSIITNDFVLENASCLAENATLFSEKLEPFDIVISNPPYFKLPINDKRSIAAKTVVNGHPNIYAMFMAISAKLLKENGELIFITPRSYASGSYFKLFREFFFKIIEIDHVHLFVSRKDTFNRDKVLQETVIIKGKRKDKNDPNHKVVISSSQGLKDIQTPESRTFSQHVLIDIKSNEKILFLPTNDFEEAIINIFKNWNGNLNKHNIQISTGPVVGFRSKDFIQENYQNGTVFLAPLFWLHNVKQMILEWPIPKPSKGQYMRIENESKSILIPNKNYILLRRFSSKDDKRIVGLCALLNSPLFDTFFRIFNGNVNVSATELREIPLPELASIKEIGDKIILSNDFSVENTNKFVVEQFELSTRLYE